MNQPNYLSEEQTKLFPTSNQSIDLSETKVSFLYGISSDAKSIKLENSVFWWCRDEFVESSLSYCRKEKCFFIKLRQHKDWACVKI